MLQNTTISTSQRSTVAPALSGVEQLSSAPMAPETKRSVSAASVDREPTTKNVTQNPAENPQTPSSDDETKKTTTCISSWMPLAALLDSGPSANQHEAAISLESEDLSWDVGPTFMYWPLQSLDALAQGEAPGPTQEMHALALDKNHDPDCSRLPAPDIYSGPVAFPVRNANAWDSPISERQDYDEADILFQQQQDFDDGAGWSAYFFQGSPDFKHEPLPWGVEHLRDPYDPRSLSPASTITLAPTLDNHNRPGSRGSLESPPASPPTSPIKGWTCTKCDKYFNERTALRKHVRYHVRPYSCPTCKKDFSVTKDLRRHQQTRGHGGQDVKELLSCLVEGCGFKFKACRRDTYKRHCRLVHEARPGRDAARGRKTNRSKGELLVEEIDKSTARTSLSDIMR